jgi:hypothetical protein
MAEAFPELQRVRGHYVCPVAGRQQHWWLVTPDGEVIDPTCRQFPSGGFGTYEPHVGPVPTGKCLCCGKYVYDSTWCCSQSCLEELTAYFEAEATSDPIASDDPSSASSSTSEGKDLAS